MALEQDEKRVSWISPFPLVGIPRCRGGAGQVRIRRKSFRRLGGPL